MRAPRVVFSELAITDILRQADWYEIRSDHKLANRWERAVTASVLRLVKMPRVGALCTFKPNALRDTRRLPVAGFPNHLIFYQYLENQIYVLRVLHGARDLEKLLSE